MAEIWGAAIMVGGAVISGVAADKKAKEDRKENRVDTKNAAKYESVLSAFNKEQDYYYQQLEKQEKMRGLDEFKKFSGMTRIDPEYVNTNTGPVLPNKPDINQMLDKVDPPKTSTGGKDRSTLDKLQDYSIGHKLFGI